LAEAEVKIALYRGNSFIGKAIRWQTRGIYSHASIVLPEGDVIEAKEFCGVRRIRGIAADKG